MRELEPLNHNETFNLLFESIQFALNQLSLRVSLSSGLNNLDKAFLDAFLEPSKRACRSRKETYTRICGGKHKTFLTHEFIVGFELLQAFQNIISKHPKADKYLLQSLQEQIDNLELWLSEQAR